MTRNEIQLLKELTAAETSAHYIKRLSRTKPYAGGKHLRR